jgi:DNA-binding SARP family transcriptional activator
MLYGQASLFVDHQSLNQHEVDRGADQDMELDGLWEENHRGQIFLSRESEVSAVATVGPIDLVDAFSVPESRHSTPDGAAAMTLLGSWSLSLGGRPLVLPSSAQRLLVLLALEGRRQRRSYLAGTLWPEVSDDKALARLRSTLWRVRRQAPGILEVDEQTVALVNVHLDVDDLVTVARRVTEGSVGPGALTEAFRVLVEARELLLGWYDEWVLEQRERLTNLRIYALEGLVDELVTWRRYGEGLDAALAAVRLDPFRESTHRAVVRVHLAEGNPASASRAVERYKKMLRTELGTDEVTPLMLELIGSKP